MNSKVVESLVSLSKGTRRAVFTAYIDFAGKIPEGEYGAGTVEIWDKGEYKLDNKVTDRIEITLTGEKLSGSYILIHTDGKNWLLIKRKPKQK